MANDRDFWSLNTLLGGIGKSTDPNNAQFSDRDYIINQVKNNLGNVGNRAAPQAGGVQVGPMMHGTGAQLDPTQQGQFRGMQMDQANRLNQIASGQMQGAGELAVQRQAVRAAAQQQAMANSQRGPNAAIAARTGATNVADIGTNAAGQSQVAALQDQQAAGAQLGQLVGQGREQDIGLASQNAQLKQQMNLANLSADNQRTFQQAGLDQATSLANMQARLQTMGMNDQAAIAYMAQLMGLNQAEMAARLAQEQTQLGQHGILGDLLSAGGQIVSSNAGKAQSAAAAGGA